MGWGAECVQAVEGGCFSHGSPQCKALAKKGGMGDISGFWYLRYFGFKRVSERELGIGQRVCGVRGK